MVVYFTHSSRVRLLYDPFHKRYTSKIKSVFFSPVSMIKDYEIIQRLQEDESLSISFLINQQEMPLRDCIYGVENETLDTSVKITDKVFS